MDIKLFWDEAVNYEEFVNHTEKAMEKAKAEGDTEYEDYYKLSLQRMKRTFKTYEPHEDHLLVMEKNGFDGKVLIIAEGWCGDCSNAVPTVSKFFAEYGIEVKITFRDQDPSMIHEFLIDGKESIPVVILLDNDLNVLGYWGSRPKHGVELLKKFKDDPEAYPREQFHADLQKYYIKNKGYDTIDEILDLV